MYYSYQNKHQKKQRTLTREDLMGLTPQQRQFAEEQFRIIYAQQMSKLTTELSHKKKIQQNINTMDEMGSKNLKQQYQKLKTKMAEIEEKRNKKLQEKTKSYKANDQRWFNKLKQIQSKFRQQNRQAFEKAQKYRQQSENYWKSKEQKIADISKTNFDNSRTKKNQTQNFNRSFMQGLSEKKKKFYPLDFDKRKTANYESNQASGRSIYTSKQQIDTQIQIHKQKSLNIQKQKQMVMFQKAMQKMDKIEQKRQKIIKQKQHKVSEPTKPKVVDNSHASIKRQKKTKNKKHLGSASFSHKSASKDSFERIKDHLETKQRLQEQQFQERGQIYENAMQKNRKQRILKMIKNKVHDMKVNALLNQSPKISQIS